MPTSLRRALTAAAIEDRRRAERRRIQRLSTNI